MQREQCGGGGVAGAAAHKTATTHLQDTLSRNGKFLLDRGYVYLPRSFIRRSRLLAAIDENHWSLMRPWDRHTELHQFLDIPGHYP